MKCDNLAEKEQQLREAIERLESEKAELIEKQAEIVTERDNLLTRCEEFTQTIYEYDVEKITMAGKMEEMQNKLEVTSCSYPTLGNFAYNNFHPKRPFLCFPSTNPLLMNPLKNFSARHWVSFIL